MKKIFFLLLICTLISCTKEKEPIRIGVNSWPPCEVWYIAQQQGYFKDTKVELVRFSAWTDNMKSLYTGKTDITHATYFNALFYSGKGEPGTIILTSDTIEGGDGFVIKSSLTPDQLKGKRIAVEINTDEHFLLDKTLRQYDLTLEDIILVNLSAGEGRDMFITNQVDALYTYEPYLSSAAEKGNGKIISTTREIPNYMMDVLVANSDKLKLHQQDFINIVNAWYDALDYINQHPEESYPLMSQNEQMAPENFKPFFESFKFFSRADNKALFQSNQYKTVLTEMADFLEKDIDIKTLYTDRLF